MTNYADLHVHTFFSDGTFSPEEVVKRAEELGFSSISICDHDCVDGLERAFACAKDKNLEIIPGVELTIMVKGIEIHMLGYFISWKEQWFIDILKHIQEQRVERIHRMVEKLKNFNVRIDVNRVLEIAGKGSVGRLHLAQAMLESRSVPSIHVAFNKYIGNFRPCYVEDIGFRPAETIEIILKAKGVPVLAHPHDRDKADEFLPMFVKYGLRGVEIFHPDMSPSTSDKYKHLAEEFGLLITGGSDCHGLGKGRVLMGSVKVPYGYVEKLKKEAKSITG